MSKIMVEVPADVYRWLERDARALSRSVEGVATAVLVGAYREAEDGGLPPLVAFKGLDAAPSKR